MTNILVNLTYHFLAQFGTCSAQFLVAELSVLSKLPVWPGRSVVEAREEETASAELSGAWDETNGSAKNSRQSAESNGKMLALSN